jgi:hypothetical protein
MPANIQHCHPEFTPKAFGASEGSLSFGSLRQRFLAAFGMTALASAAPPINPDDIRDIKGLVPLPHPWWWLVALAAAVVAGAVAFWILKQRRTTTATGTVALPTPFEAALAALQRLREEDPPVDEFYTRLSDIVRQYLERRFQLRAPERTTEEFLHEVSQDGTLAQEHKDLLGRFLQESDLVKFARFRPEPADMKRAFEAAEQFVRETGSGANFPSRDDREATVRQEPRPPTSNAVTTT